MYGIVKCPNCGFEFPRLDYIECPYCKTFLPVNPS